MPIPVETVPLCAIPSVELSPALSVYGPSAVTSAEEKSTKHALHLAVPLYTALPLLSSMVKSAPEAIRLLLCVLPGVAAPAKRDEVARRVIPADAAMHDMMNLEAAHVVAQCAAEAVAGVDGLSRLVRDGCGQISFGFHNQSPLSFDTRAATRPSRGADRPLAKPLTGVLSTEFSTNERGLDSKASRQQRPSRTGPAGSPAGAACDDFPG